MENIEIVLKELQTIKKIKVSDNLWQKIEVRTTFGKNRKIENRQKWLVAASILFLITLNLYSIIQFSRDSRSSNNNQNVVYKEYFSNN